LLIRLATIPATIGNIILPFLWLTSFPTFQSSSKQSWSVR
jgi:hypothetical protein